MEDAAAMAGYLRKKDYDLGMILCSAALRTTQTADQVLREHDVAIEYRDTLYLADAGHIVAQVRAAAPALSSLMILGHNPGLEVAAARLARESVRRKERTRYEALEEKFPTCALAILDFDVADWADVCDASGKLVDFVRPRDL